jgi:hypothetical protein
LSKWLYEVENTEIDADLGLLDLRLMLVGVFMYRQMRQVRYLE